MRSVDDRSLDSLARSGDGVGKVARDRWAYL